MAVKDSQGGDTKVKPSESVKSASGSTTQNDAVAAGVVDPKTCAVPQEVNLSHQGADAEWIEAREASN